MVGWVKGRDMVGCGWEWLVGVGWVGIRLGGLARTPLFFALWLTWNSRV